MTQRTFSIPDYLQDAQPDKPAPITLMREAAKDFSAKTGNQILGDVVTINPGGANLFRHTFNLVVPALNDYTYPLFYVWHGASLYPAHLMIAGGKPEEDARNCPEPDDLQREIESVFSSDSARQIVRAFLAQIANQSRNAPQDEGIKTI